MSLKSNALASPGAAHPGSLPLNRVPKTCGYVARERGVGFVLVVPYDGCNVTQEVRLPERDTGTWRIQGTEFLETRFDRRSSVRLLFSRMEIMC